MDSTVAFVNNFLHKQKPSRSGNLIHMNNSFMQKNENYRNQKGAQQNNIKRIKTSNDYHKAKLILFKL